jgi:hypothetical protein
MQIDANTDSRGRGLPKGIYLRKGKYIVQIRVDGRQEQVGTFRTLEEAKFALEQASERASASGDILKVKRVRSSSYTVNPVSELPKPDFIVKPERLEPNIFDKFDVDLYKIYLITCGSTSFSQWRRNYNLSRVIKFSVARAFLAKRGHVISTIDEFDRLYNKRLTELTTPWLTEYMLLGDGATAGSMKAVCRYCGKPSVIQIEKRMKRCSCSLGDDKRDTLLFFSRDSDGGLTVSVGPTRPTHVIGSLLIPWRSVVRFPDMSELSDMSEKLDHNQGLVQDSVLSRPYEATFDPFDEESTTEDEDLVADGDDVEAYKTLLEANAIDFDSLDLDEGVSSKDREVAKKLLCEDMAEKQGQNMRTVGRSGK